MKKTKISEKEKPECLNALKAYFYEDLSTNPKKNDIINLALNYFFEGIYDSKNESWKEKYNKVITEDSENKILKVKVPKNTIPVKDLEEETRNYWKKINELNEDLIRARVKKNEVIEKTLIYEAPPFHITRKDKKELYTYKYYPNYYILYKNASGTYVGTIKSTFGQKTSDIQDILINNKCGFFDIIPVPLPIDRSLRDKWIKNECYIFDNKHILVHFFEWALIEYYKKNVISITKKINHNFAVALPVLSSIPLYDYYKDDFCIAKNKVTGNFEIKDFNSLNLLNYELELTFRICIENNSSQRKKGKWLQLYKTCTIGASNYPEAYLIKHAFDLS